MRITSRGRVTIPKVIREAAGLLAHIEIEFVMDDDVVWIVRADDGTKPGRGRMLLAGLQGSGN